MIFSGYKTIIKGIRCFLLMGVKLLNQKTWTYLKGGGTELFGGTKPYNQGYEAIW